MLSKIAPAVLLSATLVLCVACEKSDIKESYFPEYEHLGKADEPGNWIPSFIPRSAKEIRAKYKIDTGAELLTFRFGRPNEITLAGYCNKATASDVELPLAGFLDVVWWPDSLARDRVKSEELAGYEIYRCERQAFLALKRNDDQHQAFYWRISLH